MPILTLLPRAGHPSNPDGAESATHAVRLEVIRGVSILDAASDHGFLIATRCGGVADCRTCRVFVAPATSREAGLSLVEEDEDEALREVDAPAEARLACQARVMGDVSVFVPDPADMEEE